MVAVCELCGVIGDSNDRRFSNNSNIRNNSRDRRQCRLCSDSRLSNYGNNSNVRDNG